MFRWQDWANALLGAWLVVSPYQLGFAREGTAAGNAMGVGGALLFFNLISAARLVDKGQEIMNVVLGLWLLLSPFAFGFEATSAAGIDVLAVGALVVTLACWQMYDAMRPKKDRQ
jgi:hypothetical protein